MRFLLAAIPAALTFATLANASIIPTLDAGNPTSAGPDYLYTYDINVSADEQLNGALSGSCTSGSCGTFFTIYDFAGYVGGTISATASNWTVEVQLTGLTPSLTNPPDSGGVVNLVFIYTGPVETGPLNIDGFSAESTTGILNTSGYYSYQAQKTANTSAADEGIGPIDVPTAASATPEPASMTLVGAGFIGLALAARKLVRP